MVRLFVVLLALASLAFGPVAPTEDLKSKTKPNSAEVVYTPEDPVDVMVEPEDEEPKVEVNWEAMPYVPSRSPEVLFLPDPEY